MKLRNFAPRDLIDLDVQKEWVDPKAHIIWDVDHPDHIRWMDQHSLDKADDRCAKVGPGAVGPHATASWISWVASCDVVRHCQDA